MVVCYGKTILSLVVVRCISYMQNPSVLSSCLAFLTAQLCCRVSLSLARQNNGIEVNLLSAALQYLFPSTTVDHT